MIRFHCTCGKVLKAPEKLAGKASRCPACAADVVVPQPASVLAGSETLEFSPSDETISVLMPGCGVSGHSISGTWVHSHNEAVDPNYEPTIQRMRGLEARPDPLRGMKFTVRLSGLLALLTALEVILYPHVLHEGSSWVGGLAVMVVWGGVMGIPLGYGCKYLDSVLEYAVSGGEKQIVVPNRDVTPAVQSVLRWVYCLCCGPALLMSSALLYWIYCGDVAELDGFVLVCLVTLAVGYWILSLLVMAERPEIAFISPQHVLQAARRLGRRALLATAGMTAAAFAYVFVGAHAVALLHSAWLMGLVLLWLCWYSAWECGVFALRIVGFWYYESREDKAWTSPRRGVCNSADLGRGAEQGRVQVETARKAD